MDSEALKRGPGKRVLVVDDEPVGREFAALRLKQAGFEVETAPGAEEALRKVAGSPPDAVVSDVRMPGMDGLQLCQAIRNDPAVARLPFLLLSSAVLEEPDQRRALELDVVAVLLRTPHLDNVVEALTALLGQAD